MAQTTSMGRRFQCHNRRHDSHWMAAYQSNEKSARYSSKLCRDNLFTPNPAKHTLYMMSFTTSHCHQRIHHHSCRSAGTERPNSTYDENSRYADIDENPVNRLFLTVFKQKIAQQLDVQVENYAEGYDGLTELANQLNDLSHPKQQRRSARDASRMILNSLFPPKLLPLFAKLIAKPFPAAANVMNAIATFLTCKWLMGPMSLSVDSGNLAFNVDDPWIEKGTTTSNEEIECDAIVTIERCRFLEESSCISVCVNSCKLPTQDFFNKDMGVNMMIEPNYDDFSCKFKFGIEAPSEEEDETLQNIPPCLQNCKKASSAKCCPL